MKKEWIKAVTFTAATTMLISTIPFTSTGVLAGENKYSATAVYNELDTAAVEKSGTWGTCTWNINDDGVLTISGGIASGSVKKTFSGAAGYEWSSPWESTSGGIKKVVIEDKITFNENTSLAHLFYGFYNLEEIDGLDNLDTSNVTDMNGMFASCNELTSLDLSTFDTSKVTDMKNMFIVCSKLKSLNLSGFDTSNVTDMNSMFESCNELTSLDLSDFNTSKVTNMYNMFYACWGLKTLDISGFDTSNVINMNSMFEYCNKLTSLDLSGFNTSNVKSMGFMFGSCGSLMLLDVSKFDTSNVAGMDYMFSGCSSLTSLDLSNFNTSKVRNMFGMFEGCGKLTSLDISKFNTSNVDGMYKMFAGCSELTSLDVSGFDTSRVTNMAGMFFNCSNLTTLDVSKFDTSSVRSMYSMFYGCNSLTGLDLSSFNLQEGILSGSGKGLKQGLLPTESENLKQIIMPSDLGKDENIKIILNDMYTIAPSWTDKTENVVYADKPDTLIAGHRYVVTSTKTEPDKNGVYVENGEIRYYENGKVNKAYTGMAADSTTGKRYWFDNGVVARDKQVYSPADDAWYWFDADGTMAVGKDVFVPKSNDDRSEGKWVRYDENGHMVKGEDYANGGWYRFDETTGEMAKGFYTVQDGDNTKLYYYNEDTGIMEHGAVNIDGTEYAFDDVTGVAVNNSWYSIDNAPYWYENGIRQGMEGRGKEIYDPASDGWYWLDAVDGGKKAVSKDVYQESYAGAYADREDGTGKWVRYDENGRMIKGWSQQNGNTYYFDLETGAMAKGSAVIDGAEHYFNTVTGVQER